jgi:hypothetical protein
MWVQVAREMADFVPLVTAGTRHGYYPGPWWCELSVGYLV